MNPHKKVNIKRDPSVDTSEPTPYGKVNILLMGKRDMFGGEPSKLKNWIPWFLQQGDKEVNNVERHILRIRVMNISTLSEDSHQYLNIHIALQMEFIGVYPLHIQVGQKDPVKMWAKSQALEFLNDTFMTDEIPYYDIHILEANQEL